MTFKDFTVPARLSNFPVAYLGETNIQPTLDSRL